MFDLPSHFFLQQPQALSRRAPHVFASQDVSSLEVSSGDA